MNKGDCTVEQERIGTLKMGVATKWKTTVTHNPSGESVSITSQASQSKAEEECFKLLKKKLDK